MYIFVLSNIKLLHMCINLQRLPNPRFRGQRPTSYPTPFGGDNQRYFINVPCGKCIECSDAKRNDLFVRASFEYKSMLKAGGIAYFVTLTYANNCLPTFNHRPCFNREDVTNFLRRLRARHFKFCKKFKHNYHGIRYFVTSEYGHETHRPHYHMVIFCYHPINEYLIPYLVRSTWHYGIVDVQSLQSNIGIHYVSKYAGKDINNRQGDADISAAIKRYKCTLFEQPWYKVKTLHNMITTYEGFVHAYKGHDKDFDAWYSTLVKFRQRKQFYLCSQHLGHDALAAAVTVRDCVYGSRISVPFCSSSYSIPQSFVKRVCNTVLGANYLQRVFSAEKSLVKLLSKIVTYEKITNSEVLDWEGIFSFSREFFISNPSISMYQWFRFVEYNPITLCWHLRRSFYSARRFFLDKLDNSFPNLVNSGHSLESDVKYFNEHVDLGMYPFDNPTTVKQMDAFYRFQEQIPDIVKLINFKPYETKLKNRREYSHKVSISPNYV